MSNHPRGPALARRSRIREMAMITLIAATAACANTDEGGNGFTRTVTAIRAQIAEYTPNFTKLKSSTDLGYRALVAKDYEKAAWHLEFEVKNSPSEPEPRLYLGQVYAETGRTEEAQQMYRSIAGLGTSASVQRDATTQGRPVAQVAAERLAALTGTQEVAAVQAEMEIANTPPEQGPDHGDAGAQVANIFPDHPLDPPPLNAPERTEPPETVVINAPPKPVEPAYVAPTPPAATTAVHLASYKRRVNANRGWDVLAREHPQLQAYEPTIIETDLGPAKGLYYRLLAGGIPSTGSARDLCKALKNQGHGWCQIGELSH
jgi:hypothetical protein